MKTAAAWSRSSALPCSPSARTPASTPALTLVSTLVSESVIADGPCLIGSQRAPSHPVPRAPSAPTSGREAAAVTNRGGPRSQLVSTDPPNRRSTMDYMDTRAAHTIDTVDDLRRHLQWAIELEHATIPPYMCALYSLDPERNPEAAQVVSTVLTEEMLHLALAANLLNAVGGAPKHRRPAAAAALSPPAPAQRRVCRRSTWSPSVPKPSTCSCRSSSRPRQKRHPSPTGTARSASSTPPSKPACAPCARN